MISRRGQQILGVCVDPGSGYHPLRQRRAGDPITSVDRRHRLIEQLVDRRGGLENTIAVHRRAPIVAHVNSVALPAST